MQGDRYAELFEAVLSLREAVELGFSNVRAEFKAEIQTQLAAQDERWNRRFNALESRVESGFAQVESNFAKVDANFAQVWNKFARVDSNFEEVRSNFVQVFSSLQSLERRLQLVEQR